MSEVDKQTEVGTKHVMVPSKRQPERNCKHNQRTNFWPVIVNYSRVTDCVGGPHFIKNVGGQSGDGEDQGDDRAPAVQEPLTILSASLWEAKGSGIQKIGLSCIILSSAS